MRKLTILVCLLIAACGRPERDPTTLIIATPGESTNLDPAAFVHTGDLAVISETYERLLTQDMVDGVPTGDFVGELASSWKVSDDGLIYDFELYEDHYFDDGTNVDAAAVKASFERIKEINRAAAHYFEWIDAIEVTERHSLRVHAKHPFPAGLAALAYTSSVVMNLAAVPEELSADERNQWWSEHSAGSGPYRMRSWDRGERLVLERNPHYHGHQPYFAAIVFKPIADPSARRIQLRKGDVDIGLTIASTNAHYYEDMTGIRLFEFPTLSQPNMWVINTQRPPFDDPRVRRAIAYGIDYDKLIDGVLDGRAQRVTTLLMPGVSGHVPDLFAFNYDPDKAQTLLYEAGFPNGIDATLTVGALGPVSETIQSFLAHVGIRIVLESVSSAAFHDRVSSGNFDIAYSGDYIDFLDPWAILGPLYNSENIGSTNTAHYHNSSVDELLGTGDQLMSADARVKAYADAQRIIAADLPYIYLFSGSLIFATRSDMSGLDFSPYLGYRMNLSKLSRQSPVEPSS